MEALYLQHLLCGPQRPLCLGQRGVQFLCLTQSVLELLLQGLQDLLFIRGLHRTSLWVGREVQVLPETRGMLLQLLHLAAVIVQG